MKPRKFFSMFMIAVAICTTEFMMTSCHDEDDVVEVKYKTVNAESSDTYSIANVCLYKKNTIPPDAIIKTKT